MLGKRKVYNAHRVKEKGSIAGFFPYLSRTRAESVIYFSKRLDITETTKFLHNQRKSGNKLSLFTIIVAACAKTFRERPMMNRFILGRRIYQREIFSISYVVKQALSDEAKELFVMAEITEDMTLDNIDQIFRKKQDAIKRNEDSALEKLMNFFSCLPRPLMRLFFFILRKLDFRGRIPAFMRNELPFYSSVFFTNLGSIGMDAPFHHLYEMGSTSIFAALGKPELETVTNPKTGSTSVRKLVTLNITADERICDGFYLARSLDRFVNYVENPEKI